MLGIQLYEEYRFVERNESEINSAWKDAHLLLFFLAFVFGSFCTFCFHMLMYLFDEKCVLFPKLLSLSSLRQNIIYEFIPEDKEIADVLPVDFLSTQWVDKSACYLPTYVPLVSGIFGLVWTTMFLMCSTGSRTLTGLQRPWRVLPPVFLFSLAMGVLCVYATAVTHYGLQELCVKLGEITGSSTCSYTMNVATLVYERRIRGVYQATRLTILTAWLHTACWLTSAFLSLLRVILVVDFQLVRISVTLQGDLEKILEKHERHIRTVSPDLLTNREIQSKSLNDMKMYFRNKLYNANIEATTSRFLAPMYNDSTDILYFDSSNPQTSDPSLVPEEKYKLERLTTYKSVTKEKQFIVKLLYEMVDSINLPKSPLEQLESSDITSETTTINRQYGQQQISSKKPLNYETKQETMNSKEIEQVTLDIRNYLQTHLNKKLSELIDKPTDSTQTFKILFDTGTKPPATGRKSNLKNKSIQVNVKDKGTPSHKVQIMGSKTSVISRDSSTESTKKANKDTQTDKKEKQD